MALSALIVTQAACRIILTPISVTSLRVPALIKDGSIVETIVYEEFDDCWGRCDDPDVRMH